MSIRRISELDDLHNVKAANPTEGQIIKYNATIEEWVNADPSDGGIVGELNDLSDVNTEGSLDGQVLTYSNTTQEWIASDNQAGVNETAIRNTWYADMFMIPNNDDWPFNRFAGLEPQYEYPSSTIRAFDDSNEEGVGFTIRVPNGATNLNLSTIGITRSPDGGYVSTRLYVREVKNGSTYPAWSIAINDLQILSETSKSFEYSSDDFTLAELGINAGLTYQFAFYRIPDNDNHEGDWNMLELGMVFS